MLILIFYLQYKVNLNNIKNFNFYLAENIMCLYYKDKSVNVI
jgi:hypothetical protein